MYAVQMLLHSVIASVLIDCAFIAWDLRSPRIKQRFRFMVIFLPILLFPVYQLLSQGRGDVYFRLGSLLDSNRWLFLDVWDGVPVFKVLILIPALTTIVFVIQELVPIVIHQVEQLRQNEESPAGEIDGPILQKMSEALEGLPFDENSVEIFDDEDFALFSNTGFNPRIYVSSGSIKSFSTEHLQAALAHEMGHIQRSRKPTLILAYIFRMLMFYNPVAMIEFRKMAQEEEEICDDIAVALTGKPEAMIGAVNMLRPAPEEYSLDTNNHGVREFASSLEQYSLDVILKNRAQRIGQGTADEPHWGFPYFMTMALIVGINYFVV